MSYADRLRQPPAQAPASLPTGWVKLPDRSPRETPEGPSLDELANDAILRMKARWYKFNDDRGLFYDYDALPDESDDSDSDESDESLHP